MCQIIPFATAEEIRKLLAETIPADDKSRAFENTITQFADTHQSKSEIAILRELMDNDSDISYKAFYVLATIFRHNRDYTKLRELIEKAVTNEQYKDRVSLKHVQVMYETHSETLYDYNELLTLAHENACEVYDNSGYQHTFANAFATICDNCLSEDLDRIIQEWYDSALFCVCRAIELDPSYAKFYSTKARIVALKNHFDESNQLLLTAIDKENSQRKDYALLIGNYQYYRTMIAIKRLQWLSSDKQKNDSNNTQKPDFSFFPFQETHSYAFISYSHKDAATVFDLIGKLKKQGVNLWFDEEIPGGSKWDEEIGKRLLNSEVVILFLSRTAVLSQNVRNEIRMAQNHSIPIIPIFLEEVLLSPGAELQLGGYHNYRRYSMPDDSFIQMLLKDLLKVTLRLPEEQCQNHLQFQNDSNQGENITVIESLCEGKLGDLVQNEDFLVVTDDFIAVIDGATSKNAKKYCGKTGGRLAAEFIEGFIRSEKFERMIDGKTAVGRIQNALKDYCKQMQFAEKGIHLCASVVIYSIARKQIWSVGDCQFILNGKLHTFAKKVDQILSQTRSLAIHMLINSGETEESLLENDKARGLILDELILQKYLENQGGEYGYSVFSDRGEVKKIDIFNVPSGSEIILASDGYPFLYDTLEKSESHLRELIKTDPLCYKKFISTKGLTKGNLCFDDRTYIRFKLIQ